MVKHFSFTSGIKNPKLRTDVLTDITFGCYVQVAAVGERPVEAVAGPR